ncbi:LysR family transcriptional regulator [Sphingobium terrigena]|uniref:LysR family transcriptional regulator n=2 Tax=Sphingobium terrigena TaxID=2304063 RepID=A0A418YMU2_9SPHN|nr:LysR family transcriptional regulator [Sphingobium terrigena]
MQVAVKFEDLRMYATVAKCGGIYPAVAQMGIPKPAVSRQISELEAWLGSCLTEFASGPRTFRDTSFW